MIIGMSKNVQREEAEGADKCLCPFFMVYGRCKRTTPYTLAPKRRNRRGGRLNGVALASEIARLRGARSDDASCWNL